MSSNKNLVILAAGRGIGIDGFNKLNLVFPSSKESILERYLRQFDAEVKIVVGYKAAEIMSLNPDLNYVYNHNWFETGSAFSTYLGAEELPVIIMPCDLFLSDDAAEVINSSKGDLLFAIDSENRSNLNAHVSHKNSEILSIYNGSRKSGNDKEFTGIVKVSTKKTLEKLKKVCETNANFFLSEAIEKVKSEFKMEILKGDIKEINSINDYIDLFKDN